ncbi:MAG: cell division protein SepF [Clostridia bacterium]|nr:cell division protein SepF [Clostridia bacterium]
MDRRSYDDYNREHFNDDGSRMSRPPYGADGRIDAGRMPADYGDAGHQPAPPVGYQQPAANMGYYPPQPPSFVAPAVPVYPAPAYYPTYYAQQPVVAPQQGVMPYGEDDEYAQDGEYGDGKKRRNGFLSMFRRKEDEMITGSDGSNIIITYPRSHHDVRVIIDNLRRRQAIIVDLSRMPDKNAQRILDFLSGAIYALCGSQQRIGPNMFLLTPGGMSIQVPIDIKKKYD